MAKSKNRKKHKERVAARNNRISNDKARAQKLQKEFIMNLIKDEQEKGMFQNTQNINGPSDGPVIDGPVID